ncbi:restriction endonuclease subunit S [Lapidilactobacillus luobeiensis]|uniref:restriction endonuclease subunit S n=1 Tax=Lapidilactobacillus luobeiensis TaxID=2950371 RepID=UPI0021C44C94|nr:restriction endonuclease subunit S [Lapidilactobacillus luobeiensis]
MNKDIYSKHSEKRGIAFELGDILFGKLRPYLKNWLHADFSGIAVGDWWVLHSENVDDTFLYVLIQGNQFQIIANQTKGTKMPRSDWNAVAQSNFSIPRTRNEQKKIGTFFQLLDNLITLHQRKSLARLYLAQT